MESWTQSCYGIVSSGTFAETSGWTLLPIRSPFGSQTASGSKSWGLWRTKSLQTPLLCTGPRLRRTYVTSWRGGSSRQTPRGDRIGQSARPPTLKRPSTALRRTSCPAEPRDGQPTRPKLRLPTTLLGEQRARTGLSMEAPDWRW